MLLLRLDFGDASIEFQLVISRHAYISRCRDAYWMSLRLTYFEYSSLPSCLRLHLPMILLATDFSAVTPSAAHCAEPED